MVLLRSSVGHELVPAPDEADHLGREAAQYRLIGLYVDSSVRPILRQPASDPSPGNPVDRNWGQTRYGGNRQ